MRNERGASSTARAPTSIGRALRQALSESPGTRMPRRRRRVTLDGYRLPAGAARGPAFASLVEDESPQTASYRALAHAVERDGYPRVILISSARRREGRTTCAINLAFALRRTRGASVLLLELDREAPALSDLLYRRPRVCLARQLADYAAGLDRDWSFLDVRPGELHAAPIDPRAEPPPLVSAPTFESAMAALRRCGYRYLVIDGPPVLGSADLPLLLDGVEGILLSARQRRSRQRDLREAAASLPSESLLGSILIDG